MLHVAFLRRDLAAGRILRIDTAVARALPGVHAVLASTDLDPVAGPLWTTTLGPPQGGPRMRLLAGDDVRYVGEPIALVVATSRYVAEDACELIEIDIESAPAVATLEAALAEGAPVVHSELGTNVVDASAAANPDLDRILAEAPPVASQDGAGRAGAGLQVGARGARPRPMR